MKRILILSFAPLLTLAALAHAADPGALVAAKRELQMAVSTGKPEQILRARARFAGLAAADPKSAPLHYWVALADWRVIPLLGHDPAQVRRHLKQGLAAIDQTLTLDPKFAEAYALKASLQGLTFMLDPQAGMSLGPEMAENLGRALGAEPANPRIAFLDALSTLNKPAFVGGGPDRALPKFKHAIELFAAESVADSTAPDWGRDDACLWAGRSAMQLKDYATAKGYFQKALEANPENGWVRDVLLPEAEKALTAPDSTRAKS